MRREDQERALVEVTSRVVDSFVQAATDREGYLEGVLSDTLYHEGLRLEKADPSDPATKAYKAVYSQARRELGSASSSRQKAMLTEITRQFAEEVVGNFDERVYRVATRALPHGLSALLKGASVRRVANMEILFRRGLQEYVSVEGEVDHVKALLNRGTLLVTPTHSSNLDSPVLGYAIYLMGIPPLTYGAGLNLFTNPVLSFFMSNLGAYKVDRRKKAALYKAVLKQYSTVALELGYHSLFFPGGTRSRSGEVERTLKKGLLGTAVRAYTNNLQSARPKPDIFVVPCTINYKLVLEAETLIKDHLAEVGKARFIITDDEFSKPRRILNFMSNLFSLDARIVVRFGKPMDVFGNPVDLEGRSLDPRGRVVDRRGYVSRGGVPVRDDQRDQQYTTELAGEIARSYGRDNVVMSTNLLGFALNNLIERANPGMDPYRLLRTGGTADSFPMSEVHSEVERVLAAVRDLPEPPALEAIIQRGDVPDIVNDALKHFAIYHTLDAAERRGDRVFHHDRNLLRFYGNRLRGYDLGRTLAAGS